MKKIFLLTALCAVFSICFAQENKTNPPAKAPVKTTPKETIVFEKTEHDFGVISGAKGAVEHTFKFKNEGTTPLVLTNASPSCGCTVADYTKDPIAPGKQGQVKATFDPKGSKNGFTKTVTVISNGNPARIILTIKGDVQ